MDVGCISSLKMHVVWVLSKWVDYEDPRCDENELFG